MYKKTPLALLFALATTAQADVQLTTSIGTTGLGLHGAMPLSHNLNARLGGNFLNYSRSGNTSDIDYEFDLKLKSIDALLDYYPNTSGFRMTGGIVLNGNRMDATGRSSAAGTYTFRGRTYSVADVGTVEGEVDFRRVAPYLGIGWGSSGAGVKGWSLAADLGAIFQGSPRTSLTSTQCTAPSPVCAQFAEDLAAENRELSNEVKNFKFYPVVRFGATYRF